MKKIFGYRFFILVIIFAVFSLTACSSSSDANSDNPVQPVQPVQKEEVTTEQSLLSGMDIYYGSLHSHTKYSWGEVKDYSPADAFENAKIEGLDFYAVTDHDMWLGTYLLNDAWAATGNDADNATVDGEFVAIRGFEYSNPTYGHICIFETDSFTDFLSTPFNKLPLFPMNIYEWIEANGAIAEFNHPGRESNCFHHLKYDATVADNFVAMETGNKETGNFEGEFIPYYIQALDLGWKIAPTSNQDDHRFQINSHRTVIIAPDLTRESLFEALKARRAYSSDDPNARVIFKAGEDWMGSDVKTDSSSIELTVMVNDDEPIISTQIITNGGQVVAAKSFDFGTKSALWKVTVPCKDGSYFFLKVRCENVNDGDNPEDLIVTAPVWVSASK